MVGGGGDCRPVCIGGYLLDLKCLALLSPDYAEHRAPLAARDLISKRTLNEVRALLVGRLGGLYGRWFNAWRVEIGKCPKKRPTHTFRQKADRPLGP